MNTLHELDDLLDGLRDKIRKFQDALERLERDTTIEIGSLFLHGEVKAAAREGLRNVFRQEIAIAIENAMSRMATLSVRFDDETRDGEIEQAKLEPDPNVSDDIVETLAKEKAANQIF